MHIAALTKHRFIQTNESVFQRKKDSFIADAAGAWVATGENENNTMFPSLQVEQTKTWDFLPYLWSS